MAEILPFKAWRYNRRLSENLEEYTAPLFDVVSERQRQVQEVARKVELEHLLARRPRDLSFVRDVLGMRRNPVFPPG